MFHTGVTIIRIFKDTFKSKNILDIISVNINMYDGCVMCHLVTLPPGLTDIIYIITFPAGLTALSTYTGSGYLSLKTKSIK